MEVEEEQKQKAKELKQKSKDTYQVGKLFDGKAKGKKGVKKGVVRVTDKTKKKDAMNADEEVQRYLKELGIA